MHLRSVRFAILGALFLCSLTLSKAQDKHRIPTEVKECELRGKAVLCSTWWWDGTGYDGTWPDGSIGRMTIRFIDSPPGFLGGRGATHVTFTRLDTKGTAAGLTAVYQCTVHNGKVENGWVGWKINGVMRQQRWKGTFFYGPVLHPAEPVKPLAASPSVERAPAPSLAPLPRPAAAAPATPAADAPLSFEKWIECAGKPNCS